MSGRKHASDFYSAYAQGTALYVKWAANRGMSYQEVLVLYSLHAENGITQKSICNGYGLPKQTVNAVVRSLKERGYITLQPGEKDRREKIMTLTAEGSEYTERALGPLFDIEERVCRNIDEERFLGMTETMELFNLLFEKEMERDLQKDE